MSDNDISDDGMAVISEALQHNKSLTVLKVAQCGLSVKGIAVLHSIYHTARKFRGLKVSWIA